MRVECEWCGKRRGAVYVDAKLGDRFSGAYAILFCPRCDFAHEHAAGPPIENRARDVR